MPHLWVSWAFFGGDPLPGRVLVSNGQYQISHRKVLRGDYSWPLTVRTYPPWTITSCCSQTSMYGGRNQHDRRLQSCYSFSQWRRSLCRVEFPWTSGSQPPIKGRIFLIPESFKKLSLYAKCQLVCDPLITCKSFCDKYNLSYKSLEICILIWWRGMLILR